jgi:hypothetical protein
MVLAQERENVYRSVINVKTSAKAEHKTPSADRSLVSRHHNRTKLRVAARADDEDDYVHSAEESDITSKQATFKHHRSTERLMQKDYQIAKNKQDPNMATFGKSPRKIKHVKGYLPVQTQIKPSKESLSSLQGKLAPHGHQKSMTQEQLEATRCQNSIGQSTNSLAENSRYVSHQTVK